MDFGDDRAFLTRNYMMKLDFEKIIYQKATYLPWPSSKVYDFFGKREFHIFVRTNLSKRTLFIYEILKIDIFNISRHV